MADSNFIDYVKIHCKSGKGGAGSHHFFRDKLNSRGGPDGGDGGRGGNIVLKGNAQMWTLLHLKYRKHIKADPGKPGGGSRSTGKSGEDIFLDVPLGTVAKDAETGDFLFEITEDGEQKILLEGGRGGLGNWHFKSAQKQNPKYAQPGEDGREDWKVLELKVLADVGLVGFPNAGKSTLLASITAAKPEIADYPFTTITPNLGIVAYREWQSFVVADIPGIIEGAHLGKGLGHRFLKHIERNAALLFLIPCNSENIKKEYKILLKECEKFNPELMQKQRLVAITQCDTIDDAALKKLKTKLKTLNPMFISSVSGMGLEQLKDKLWEVINN
mgnify:CR=1 FL=1